MAKDLTMSLLLDFYGDILPERQREAMDLFYNGDLSLSEIAETTGLTRQGVRDRIVKGEKTVSELEDKLGLAGRFGDVKKTVRFIVGRLEEIQKETGVPLGDVIEAVRKLEG